MTKLEGLYVQQKIAYDMYKSSKNEKEAMYYAKELEKIMTEIKTYKDNLEIK